MLLSILFLQICLGCLCSHNDVSTSFDFRSAIVDWKSNSTRASSICDRTALNNSSVTVLHTSARACSNNLTEKDSITKGTLLDSKEVTDKEKIADESVEAAPKQPIATFDEWTKEKLKQEHRKVMASPPHTGHQPQAISGSSKVEVSSISSEAAPTRNYASKECGAKILQSNVEAENSKAVLNDKEKDEYMRNPCAKADHKFVIMELCETIQPRSIELANFELFSSGPRDVRFWVAERFPNGEWTLLAQVTAADTRSLQTFSVPERIYAKFIKVELLTHYGNEHYCTLSVLKVLGISMVDEYEIEAEAAVRLPTMNTDTDAQIPEQSTDVIPPTVSDNSVHNEVSNDHITKKTVEVVQERSSEKSASPASWAGSRRVFDIHLCHTCPVFRSCTVSTHLCWVFVWRPPRKSSACNSTFLLPSNRRTARNRLQRHGLAYLRRNSFVTYEDSRSPMPEEPELLPALEIETQVTQESDVKVSPEVLPPSQESSHTVQSNVNPTPSSTITADSIPAASVSHKESVFMKLNKRIAALELNMSLSSQYLSELSRQYVAQTDEHMKQLEQAKRAAQLVASNVESRLNETISEKLFAIRKEMDSLSAWLSSMRIAASELVLKRVSHGDSGSADWKDVRARCLADDGTDVKQFLGTQDGMWTTEQVVYAVLTAQITTVAVIGLLVCFSWLRSRGYELDEGAVERLVEEKLEKLLLRQTPAVSQPSEKRDEDEPNKKKKKKKRKKNKNENNTPIPNVVSAAGVPRSDVGSSSGSVGSMSTTPSETSSEAESSKPYVH